ncbi:MAG TPA: hypothetical protein VE377_24760 [Candidatus Dormibacteraeota bacterium]|nr:hypothetical protein [Candidatus Dormibacteraeota bacterium]
MKSFIHEAEQARGVGAAFVVKARTVADKLDIPVEWLLAAMSWETTQYAAYHPDTNSWARNTSDGGGGLVGFTPFTPALAAKAPIDQLDDVENYLRNTIKNFKIPTPFASPEDFYCVIYAPGISGKPDSYTWSYMGTTYTKGTQMGIYRGFLGRYDMPKTGDDLEGTDDSFLWWAPGEKKQVGWAKTTDANVPVRSGPARSYNTVSWLPLSGTRVQVLDQTRSGDIIDGNAKWDRIAAGYVSDTQIAFE